MKILLLSDLHLSVQPLAAPDTQADVVILAGDLGRPPAAIAWARQFNQPTLFVAGNHEYYGSDLQSTIAELQSLASDSAVNVLECSERIIDGVRFLGCTLWSDHRLYETEQAREQGMALAVNVLHDFTRITCAPGSDEKFTPLMAQQLCDQSLGWLDEQFAAPFDGPTVVITHFAPTRQSIHAQFADSPLNACFVSDLETQILQWQPALWVHGHTHNSFDYQVGKTRVVCNPRGYAPGGEIENPKFDPNLTLLI